jgi:predicted TIM-barrel fold metal-dependent hydrolase
MILDGHIHIRDGERDRTKFLSDLKDAGVDGGAVISLPPPAFPAVARSAPADKRLEDVLWWCEESDALYPLFWIDPLEDHALDQVDRAVTAGIVGFKMICDRYDPGDERALPVYRRIAEANKPVLFHSGILWDGKASSPYNRPAEFEALLEIPNLRFCIAHISWPWCDEAIAVYGKFLNASETRQDLSVEMFIDTTPGTPVIYRKDVLTKIYTIGYDIENNIIFGADCSANHYNVNWTREWIERDTKILDELKVSKRDQDRLFSRNLQRFLRVSGERISRKGLRPGE